MIETLLFSLALRVTGLGVQQPDTEQTTGTLHPMCAVLRTVVKVDGIKLSVAKDCLMKCVLYDRFFLIVIESGMKQIP